MAKPFDGARVRVAQQRPYRILVVGEPKETLRDLYHRYLRMPWSWALVLIIALFFAANAVFALGYFLAGGVAHTDGSFRAAFFFSVQTLGTIGYGAMYPESLAAHLLVTIESLCGLLITAISAGLVFAKVSQPHGRLVFSDRIVVTRFEGKPTLMIRLGNERANQILEAQVHLDMIYTQKTQEGETFYRQVELPLARSRSAALARSWTVMHVIDAASPLHETDGATLREREVELTVSVMGVDDTSAQPVHGRHVYGADQIVFNARYADVLSETKDGDLVLDVRRFHEVETQADPPSAGSGR
jgi:inward rectifier potassium channel